MRDVSEIVTQSEMETIPPANASLKYRIKYFHTDFIFSKKSLFHYQKKNIV